MYHQDTYIYTSIIYTTDRATLHSLKKKVKLNDHRDNKWSD